MICPGDLVRWADADDPLDPIGRASLWTKPGVAEHLDGARHWVSSRSVMTVAYVDPYVDPAKPGFYRLLLVCGLTIGWTWACWVRKVEP